MYTCHFSVLRTSVVREVGGFHDGFEGSQDHDLVLRVTERARKILHIPRILYHWRVIPGSAAGDPVAKPYAWVAGVKAVQAQMDRLGIDATVDFGPGHSTYAITRKLDPRVLVSVVIPTCGPDGLVWGERRHYVVEAVRSLIEHSGHDHLEVVVVHDTSTPPKVLEQLRQVAPRQLRLVPYDRPFDFSEKCNIGVLARPGRCRGAAQRRRRDHLRRLRHPAGRPTVRGGRRDDRWRGCCFPTGGSRTLEWPSTSGSRTGSVAGTSWTSAPSSSARARAYRVGSVTITNHEVSAISAVCLAIKKSLYLEVGGLSEELPLNFGDVDLSLKVRQAGYRLLWMAGPTAYHFGARSRQPLVHAREVRALSRRWLLPNHDLYVPCLPESRPPTGGKHPAREPARARWQ